MVLPLAAHMQSIQHDLCLVWDAFEILLLELLKKNVCVRSKRIWDLLDWNNHSRVVVTKERLLSPQQPETFPVYIRSWPFFAQNPLSLPTSLRIKTQTLTIPSRAFWNLTFLLQPDLSIPSGSLSLPSLLPPDPLPSFPCLESPCSRDPPGTHSLTFLCSSHLLSEI